MRYDPNRHYLYPVARPFSDDYADGVFSTGLQLERVSNTLHITISYEITDATIYKLVSHSDARCIAMVYCVDTMYRYALLDNNGDAFRVVGSIPLDTLKNQVIVYPSVVARTHIDNFLSNNVNAEYENGYFSIKMGQPLAFDSPWYFSVDPTRLRIQSIFRLVTDVEDKLRLNEFDVRIDPNKKYIDIAVDEGTRRRIEKLRSNKNITFPSIYLSSLVSVLSDFRELDEMYDISVPEGYPSDGWFWCIRHKLQEQGIALSDNNGRSYHSLIKAAQQLLSGRGNLRPLRRLFEQNEVSDD